MEFDDLIKNHDKLNAWIKGWQDDCRAGRHIGVRIIHDFAERIKSQYCTNDVWDLGARVAYDLLLNAAVEAARAGKASAGFAVVAEPLNLHGWQLVDELNRLLANEPVSGYIVPVHLVTLENISYDLCSLLQYDPNNSDRDIYRKIWKR